MRGANHVPVVLKCHGVSACTAVQDLRVTAHALDGRLTLHYALDADLSRVMIPAAAAPQRGHELWMHTCFEAFLGQEGSPGYCELNFAPSSLWAMYRFSARRQGMQAICDARPPQITVSRTRAGLELEARVLLHDLFPAAEPLGLRLGLAAVVEDADARLTYWAARHAPGKPDFHHPDNFIIELPP